MEDKQTRMANKSKLVKVTMEYGDGEVASLSGDDAEKWLKAVNGCIFIAAVHCCGISDFDWVVERESGKNDDV